MHAADEPIRLEHQIAAGGRLQRSGVIEKSQGRRMLRQRTEVARDQTFLPG
jgi:hypothetical protein